MGGRSLTEDRLQALQLCRSEGTNTRLPSQHPTQASFPTCMGSPSILGGPRTPRGWLSFLQLCKLSNIESLGPRPEPANLGRIHSGTFEPPEHCWGTSVHNVLLPNRVGILGSTCPEAPRQFPHTHGAAWGQELHPLHCAPLLGLGGMGWGGWPLSGGCSWPTGS